MIEILVLEGCEDPENRDQILMSTLKSKLEDGTFDIELFNQMIKHDCNYDVWSANHKFD